MNKTRVILLWATGTLLMTMIGSEVRAALLTGSLSAANVSVNLTSEGIEDWAIWGYADGGTSMSLAPDVRKSGGSVISNLTDITRI